MKLNDYQLQAMQSLAITERSVAALAHRTLGLAGEAGIVSNAMKKVIRDKQGTLGADDVAILKEKLGDVLYYVAVLAEFADLKLDDVAEANLNKSTAFKNSRPKT